MSDPVLRPLSSAQDPVSLLGSGLPDTGYRTAEAARQFEGMLMQMLFQTMRKTVEPSGLFGEGGQARSTYEFLLDQAVVEKAVASGRGWGLAERLESAWAAPGKASHPLTDPGKLPIDKPTR